MLVIPVLDLKGGRAVHACGGDRTRYAPVDGVLGRGEDPLALAAAFRDRLGCGQVYVADLDAITGSADPRPMLAALAGLGLAPWTDAGVRTPQAAEALLRAGAAQVVVGLETLRSLDELRAVLDRVGAERTVFSLDVHDGKPLAVSPQLAALDPLEIAAGAVAARVRRLICLDLARVGSGAGPVHPLLERLCARLPEMEIWAGGGVRDAADLAALAALGCAGALVGTALHAGRIIAADLGSLRR